MKLADSDGAGLVSCAEYEKSYQQQPEKLS